MNSQIATLLKLPLIKIILLAFRQISILLLPTSRSPFNDWWAHSHFFKLALIPIYCSLSSFFLSTAHLPNPITLRLPSEFCGTSKGLDHIACIMAETSFSYLSQDFLMQTGLVTNKIAHPSLASFGLLEEVPSAGRQRNKIVSLSQQLKLSMLPSHVQGIWLRQSLDQFRIDCPCPLVLSTDNNAKSLSVNDSNNGKAKHINIRYHFIRSHIESGSFVVKHTPGIENTADIFIKPLSHIIFQSHVAHLGLSAC
jgi:hypothetical protein